MSGEQADPYAAYPSVGEELHQTMSADEIAERLSAYVSRDADPNDPSFVDYLSSKSADEMHNQFRKTIEAWVSAGELLHGLTQYNVLKKCHQEGFRLHRHAEQRLRLAEECAPAVGATVTPTPAAMKPTTPLQANRSAPGCVHYGLPRPEAWRDVRLRFHDGETLSIKVGDADRKLISYFEIGLATKRKKPDVQWQMLRRLGEAENGTLYKRDSHQRKAQAVKMQIQRLSKALKSFFGIEAPPITAVDRKTGWKTAFIVEPETRI
jgi:hypothetical protein